MTTKANVTQYFLRWKLPVDMLGYTYAKECIEMVLDNGFTSFGKVLYPAIAKKHDTDIQNVERCIRSFINRMWKSSKFRERFLYRPSVREFVFRCAEYVRLNIELEKDLKNRSVYDILDSDEDWDSRTS